MKKGTLQKHLLARMANPEKDVDLYDEPLDIYYAVFVKVSDCEVTERHPCGSPKRVKTENAPQYLKLHYSLTYSGFTEWVKVKPKRMLSFKKSSGEIINIEFYFRRKKYTVEEGKVYMKYCYAYDYVPTGYTKKLKKESTRNVLIEKNN